MAHLFEPYRLAGLDLANRLVVAPMCQYSADEGCANDWHVAHLVSMANSGAGLVVIEATGVEPLGRITHGCLGLYDDATEKALARAVAAVKRFGQAKIGIQIGHAGRKASSQRPWEGGKALSPDEAPWQTYAPSPIPFDEGWPTPAELTVSDIGRIRAAHAEAAKRALAIGMDSLEIHGAHGYLTHSFHSPISNRRTDAYGGSREGRMRFGLEVAEAVRGVWPKGKPLGMRITGRDWMEGGLEIEDAVVFARELEARGLDFVCVSSGGVIPKARIEVGPGYQVPFAAAVKAGTSLAVRAVGLIATPAQADGIIAEGKADMVAIARAVLDDPHWGWHAAGKLGAEVARPVQYARAAPKVWPGASYR